MLDTQRLVETPEGIALRLDTAGVWPRAAAWVIDFLIRAGALMLASMLLAFLDETGVGLYLLLLFTLFWLYPILFEVLRDGQTIGKRVIGLRVVNGNGTPVTWLASIVRNLMRTVDMLPFGYGFGLIAGLIDPQGRRLGDLVAGTVVVHVHAAAAPVALSAVPALPAPVALSREEKAVLVAFAERSPRLTGERQQELAELLPALTQARGALAVQRLLGIAHGLLGRGG